MSNSCFCCVQGNQPIHNQDVSNEHSNVSDKSQRTNSSKLILIFSGAILALAGLFVLLASLQVVPNGINAVSSWGVWGKAAAALLIGSGVVAVVIGILRNRISELVTKKANDSVNDYECATLKQIADVLIKNVYYRKFVPDRIYVIQREDSGDTVMGTRYPNTQEEIQEYEQKVPNIVDAARRGVEKELKMAVSIPQLLDTLEKHHDTLFPYMF